MYAIDGKVGILNVPKNITNVTRYSLYKLQAFEIYESLQFVRDSLLICRKF